MKAEYRQRGFTLIEMLTVIVIILVLAGILATALWKARQKAYRLRAATETRDLVKAWKSFFETYGTLPYSGDLRMDADRVKTLQGNALGNNPQNIRFYQFPLDADSKGFKDPWGKENYYVSLSTPPMTTNWSYATRVHFVHRRREQYE